MAKWGEINCPRCAELEAKLAQQDDLVQAAVAAALREAAKKCRQGDIIYADSAADHILALIAPDAQAALDRVVAAALREAANACVNEYLDDLQGTKSDTAYQHAVADCVTAVLALIPKGGE